MGRRAQDPQIRVRRTLRVPPASRRAPGTLHSETECSGQTLRNRRVWKRAVAGRRASTISTANMSEDKHTWYRVQAWDGDKRQWKRYLRDVDLNLETEKLDVDFSHGARLPSRLTGSARKYAETIELDQIRRSTGTDRHSRGNDRSSREPCAWKMPRRRGKSRSSFVRNSKGVQDNPWPNGSTSLRRRC